jgi:hypothetical protein
MELIRPPFYHTKANKILKKIIQENDYISQQLHDHICSEIIMSDGLEGLNREVMCNYLRHASLMKNDVNKAEML